MANTNTRSRRGSVTGRQSSSIIDTNENKQLKQQIPVKVLVFNGKCSEIFKSTLEECVEDCILEFPGQNSIYVSKPGQAIQIPPGSKHNYSKDLNHSAKSTRRRSSITQYNLPQINGMRTNQTNNFSLPTAAMAATSVSRMRNHLMQQKFSLNENISEEATDLQTTVEPIQNPITIEPDSEHPQILQEEPINHPSNVDTLPQSPPSAHRKTPSASTHITYRDRQKDFLLSDLVMLGPEYFAHIFNLPRQSRYTVRTPSRQRSSTQQRRNRTAEKYSELDRIKQDLFHRYLWTQKPQVSCRIRPMSTYTRSTTFVI